MHQQSRHQMSKEAQETADLLQCRGIERVTDFVNEAHQRSVHIDRDDVLGFIDRNRASRQHYTPDEVAEFMATIGMRHRPRTALDPACGVGNLLYYCSSAEQVVGIDIDNKLTPVASLLCPGADLRHADFLNTERDRLFDLVIIDPPWGLLDGSSRTPYEQRMVERSLECLAPNGVLVALVPPSLLWSDRAAAFREMVLRDYSLEAVVSLWPGALHTTSIGSAVIVIEKRPPKPRVFVAVADGPDDLPRLAVHLEHQEPSRTMDTDMLTEGWNPVRLLLRQAESESLIPYQQLSDLAEVIPGASLPRDLRRKHGDLLVFSPRHVRDGHLAPKAGDADYVDTETAEGHQQCIALPGDIVMYLRFTPGLIYSILPHDQRCIIPNGFAIVRSELSSYVRAFLSTAEHRKLVLDKARAHAQGSVIKSLSLTDVRYMRIPILPLDDPNDLDPESLRKKTPDQQAEILDGLVAIDKDYTSRVDYTASPSKRAVFCEAKIEPYRRLAPLARASNRPDTEQESGNLHRELAPVVELLLAVTSESRTRTDRLEQAIAQISQYFGLVLQNQQASSDAVARIQLEVTAVHTDTAAIVSHLDVLQTSFASIKDSEQTIDEKLESLRTVMDRMTATVHDIGTDLGPYTESATLLIPRWKWMETISQASLTMAEYLLKDFEPMKEADYSPCVLEYSKTLENELLAKVFIRFVDSLKTPAFAESLRGGLDAEARDNGDSMKFAKAVRSYLFGDGNLRFSLGDMLYELQNARENVNPGDSLVRCRFTEYLTSQTDVAQALNQSSLGKLQRFKDLYRNPCAHPARLDRSTAIHCRKEVPIDIEWVLSAARVPPPSST